MHVQTKVLNKIYYTLRFFKYNRHKDANILNLVYYMHDLLKAVSISQCIVFIRDNMRRNKFMISNLVYEKQRKLKRSILSLTNSAL